MCFKFQTFCRAKKMSQPPDLSKVVWVYRMLGDDKFMKVVPSKKITKDLFEHFYFKFFLWELNVYIVEFVDLNNGNINQEFVEFEFDFILFSILNFIIFYCV